MPFMWHGAGRFSHYRGRQAEEVGCEARAAGARLLEARRLTLRRLPRKAKARVLIGSGRHG